MAPASGRSDGANDRADDGPFDGSTPPVAATPSIRPADEPTPKKKKNARKQCRGCQALHGNSCLGTCKLNPNLEAGREGRDHVILRQEEYDKQGKELLASLRREGSGSR